MSVCRAAAMGLCTARPPTLLQRNPEPRSRHPRHPCLLTQQRYALILAFIWAHTGSGWLGLLGTLLIVASVPISLYLYMVVLGIPLVGFVHGIGFFLIIGSAAWPESGHGAEETSSAAGQRVATERRPPQHR